MVIAVVRRFSCKMDNALEKLNDPKNFMETRRVCELKIDHGYPIHKFFGPSVSCREVQLILHDNYFSMEDLAEFDDEGQVDQLFFKIQLASNFSEMSLVSAFTTILEHPFKMYTFVRTATPKRCQRIDTYSIDHFKIVEFFYMSAREKVTE